MELAIALTGQDGGVLALGRAAAGEGALVYRVELRNAEKTAVEQVVARASSAALAQAVFAAAQREYPGRVLTLSDGRRIVGEVAGRGAES